MNFGPVDRRGFLGHVILIPPAALLLPACVTMGRSLDLASILRDLLSLSAQRAFARLIAPGGFDDALVRLDLPPELGGSMAGGIASALLSTPMVRNRLLEQVNKAAGFAAKAAEPIVEDAIGTLTFADAATVLRGGPTSATDVLERAIGASLGGRLVPVAGEGLRVGDSDIVTQVLRAASGFDLNRLADDVGEKASHSIFKAIGREESAIRANPQSTNNPALIAALAGLS